VSEAIPLYRCDNDHCSLGGLFNPGYFTGGATAELANVITGKPVESMVEGEDYGPGVCPNCGSAGEREGEHEYVEDEA